MLPKPTSTTVMPALKESHIVRIAVELENQSTQLPQLIKFDRRQPLTGQCVILKNLSIMG